MPSDSLLAAAGIAPAQVAVPGSRLSAEQAFALWEEARRATGEPLIAEHVTGLLPFGSHRIADYLLMTGSTPREALQKFIRLRRELRLRLADSVIDLPSRTPYYLQTPDV